MHLKIDVMKDKEESTVLLTGEIDVYTAPKLKAKLLPLTQIKDHLLIVNLEHVDYMDSTGLGVFIHALKSTKKHHSHMKLVHLQDRVLRLFKITGLNEIIHINSGVRWK